jgi:Domain of unknown function (DUF3576)
VVAKSTFFIAFLVFFFETHLKTGWAGSSEVVISHQPVTGQANGGGPPTKPETLMHLCHSGLAGSVAFALAGTGPSLYTPRDEQSDRSRLLKDMRSLFLTAAVLAALAGCSGDSELQKQRALERRNEYEEISDESIFDLFRQRGDVEREVPVNRFLWQASLDTLSFLPLDQADPFSGLLVTGWGNVNGAGPFRVTVFVSDPALDARALKVAAFRLSGGRAIPVGDAENRALEDAILTRARQLRIAQATD